MEKTDTTKKPIAVIRTSQLPRELLERVCLQIQSKKAQMEADKRELA